MSTPTTETASDHNPICFKIEISSFNKHKCNRNTQRKITAWNKANVDNLIDYQNNLAMLIRNIVDFNLETEMGIDAYYNN